MAIRSFSDGAAEAFFLTGHLKRTVGWSATRKVLKRKLDMLHYAGALEDLRSPPDNRLEALKGRMHGYHSVRVNDRWRIVFRWTFGGPTMVRVTDYH